MRLLWVLLHCVIDAGAQKEEEVVFLLDVENNRLDALGRIEKRSVNVENRVHHIQGPVRASLGVNGGPSPSTCTGGMVPIVRENVCKEKAKEMAHSHTHTHTHTDVHAYATYAFEHRGNLGSSL